MKESIKENLNEILSKLENTEAKLIAVTKTHPLEKLQTLYDLGFKVFGENRVQELTEKLSGNNSGILLEIMDETGKRDFRGFGL